MTTMMWMVWSVLVAGLFAASAWLAESALRERGWPTRWPWLVALIGSLAAPLLAWLRPGDSSREAAVGRPTEGWALLDPAWFADLSTAAVTAQPVAQGAEDVLLVGWVVLSVAGIAALVGGLTVLRARAAQWHRARVHDEYVLLSRDFGPALVGVVHPEIVLPRWALRMPEEDQRLACLHEAEHRAAHDTWLLLAGALCLASMPWNPALWWQLRRLRAAVEVDCDGRVLRRGASRRAYGALLLELGSARRPGPLTVLAFARSESLLERRLKMIVRNVRDRNPTRAVVAASLSAALFALACETEAPTTLEETIQAAVEDGATTTIEAKELPFGAVAQATPRVVAEFQAKLDEAGGRLVFDGVERDAVPGDLDPATIDRVEVRKDPDGTASAVYVFTKKASEGGVAAGTEQATGASTIRLRRIDGDGEPLVYVDGVRIEGSLPDMPPETIERVEVIKGEAARALYGDEGANGVVQITLKKVPG